MQSSTPTATEMSSINTVRSSYMTITIILTNTETLPLERMKSSREKDGSMIIRANKRLNVYNTEVNGETDYSIEFKDLYVSENGRPYSIAGGYINIPQQYKTKNKKGNIIISADFFKDEQYKRFLYF